MIDRRSQEARRRWRRHWIDDPLSGLRMTLAHEALRLLPTDFVSRVGQRLTPRLAPRFNRRVDGRIRAGLAAIRTELGANDAALDAAAAQAWGSIGGSYAEFSVLDRLWVEGRIRVEGREHTRGGCSRATATR